MKKNLIDLSIKEMFDICHNASVRGGCKFCPIFELEMKNDDCFCIPSYYSEKYLSFVVDVDDFSER